MKCTVAVENRKEPRFAVFFKVWARDLSRFSGGIEGVSKSGCRLRFPDAEDFDLDGEYAVTVCPQPNSGNRNFELTVKPRWIQRVENGAVVGCSVLCSPGYRQFLRLVHQISADADDPDAAP